MTSFSQKVQKPCFGAILTIAGRFFQKEIFSKNLGFVTQNKVPQYHGKVQKKRVNSEKSYGRMDFRPRVAVQKRKKDAGQCTNRFCLKRINYFINKQMSSSTTEIISNVPICTVTVSSKLRKNSIELLIQAIL